MDATIIIPLIVAIVELVKKLNKVPSEYMPFLAVILGVILTTIESPYSDKIWAGVIVGLTAVGLFEAGKNGVSLTEDKGKELWTKLFTKK